MVASKYKKQKQHAGESEEATVARLFKDAWLRPVALEVAYVGFGFQGFARQDSTQNTVEEALITALTRTRLVKDIGACNYSRCGRTDKGVSAFGQVIGLNIRSNLPKWQAVEEGLASPDILTGDEVAAVDVQGEKKRKTEYNYLAMLNGSLPDEIRVLSWAPTKEGFSARFDCTSRMYKYFFLRQDYDVDKMKEAAALYVGTHNFKNYCKNDTAKETLFERTVMQAKIEPVSVSEKAPWMDVFVFNVEGKGFLYHQVRCLMGVLYLIGKGLEDVSLVTQLYDVKRYPSKPGYEMASELPLVLWKCAFDGLSFPRSHDTSMPILRVFRSLLHDYYLQGIAVQHMSDAFEASIAASGAASSDDPDARIVIAPSKTLSYTRIPDRKKH